MGVGFGVSASEAGAETVAAYMETCTQMRRDRLTAYLATLFSRIASAAEAGDLERVLGRCAAGLGRQGTQRHSAHGRENNHAARMRGGGDMQTSHKTC